MSIKIFFKEIASVCEFVFIYFIEYEERRDDYILPFVVW